MTSRPSSSGFVTSAERKSLERLPHPGRDEADLGPDYFTR